MAFFLGKPAVYIQSHGKWKRGASPPESLSCQRQSAMPPAASVLDRATSSERMRMAVGSRLS